MARDGTLPCKAMMRVLFPSQHRRHILELERELKEAKNATGVAWALYNGEADDNVLKRERMLTARGKVLLIDASPAGSLNAKLKAAAVELLHP